MTKPIVDECMNITNAIRTDYEIDILETNDNYEITDKIIGRLLSDIHCISIKLPTVVEMQLRNSRLLKDMINNYRHHERYLNLLKKKKPSAIESIDDDDDEEEEEDILMIEAKSLCQMESNHTYDSLSVMIPENKASLTKLVKRIHQQHENQSHKKTNSLDKIKALLKFIINEEITYEYLQNEIKISNEQNQSKQLRTKRKKKNQTIQILPYENTYNEFYYPDHFISIEQTMIDKIVNGVQAMAAALTNRKDIENVLNGIVMLADQSTSPADELMSTIQKHTLAEKQGYTNNRERIRVRMALDLILADNRLTGKSTVCPPESIVLSRMIRKISLCTQTRTLCSYGDVITIINDSDYHQIRLRTCTRMSLSSDEFIEILGEMYRTSYDTIESMKYYLDANDIIDLDTNLIYSSILTSKQVDDMIKYIVREDAIRQLLKLIFDRTRNSDSYMNSEQIQFKLILPMKLNELYQTIKKLNAFMSTSQVMTTLRKPYISQLEKRSKTKPITVNDLRAIISQIWLTQENIDALISEKTMTIETLSQFYIDFHAIEDIDDRLNKICKKIQQHLNLHSCTTRVVLKMIAEHSNGTIVTPFLNEFNRAPRFISIVDIFDDLISSGLISTTELLVYSRQDIIIKKSSLLKHFESIAFFHKRDADLLAEITLIMREDDLIEYLTQRAKTIKETYINSILNNDERRDFITKNLIESKNRLSSLSIHEFIRYFNLDPNCGKIFYWMGLTDENIVKTLIEIKTFVNEYTLDGIYNNFLMRLHDTLESDSYYISPEYLTMKNLHQIITEHFCKLGCYLTYKQASILVDYADPEYEHEILSLMTVHDIILQENLKSLLKSSNSEVNFDDISSLILPKQQVIECKTLLDSFRRRINYRQKRFKRIENLQKFLLSSMLIEQFIEMLSNLGVEYFRPIELDYLEDIKLIDIGVLAILLTLPSYNSRFHNKLDHYQNDQQTSNITANYLHILDPVIEKYSIFLTTIIIRIISKKERFEQVNEILLSNSDYYVSTEEVLKICADEQILTHDNIQQICHDIFPTIKTPDANISVAGSDLQGTSSTVVCYTQHISMYTYDSVLRNKIEQTVILTIFDYILHFNHRTAVNEQLRQLFYRLKPLAFYKAQLVIEKELTMIKLLLKIRKKQTPPLRIHDLNRYLESYPIPCRLDIVNELRRMNIISQSLTNEYTMSQCYELKSSTPEGQAIFLFYMLIKLIQKEGYIDETSVREILNQHQTNQENENFNTIFKHILRNGFLTIEQISQSAKDFFLQDYLNEGTLKSQSNEYKTVIQEQFLTNIFKQKSLTNTQFELALSQNMRRCQVIQTNLLGDQLKHARIAKERVQRKVDHVLLKTDENPQPNSKTASRLTYGLNIESSPNLRSLRHNYIQARIPRNQLHLLVEQGGWSRDIYLEFKRELHIIDSDNSLDLIRHITNNISLLLKENGSIAENPLMKHFQQHKILFLADFELLLVRYGMVALDDLIDLLTVSKLAKVNEIKSYAKPIFCLNVNKFKEISKSEENGLVKKSHVQNNLENKLCINPVDLSRLLNHVLKLDRLKRIIGMMATIRSYIRLHPINTFNALNALKLEFDFSHNDMKFLRDLRLLNDLWYKRYLLSQKNETDPRDTETAEEEQEEQNQFKFQSPNDEEFDLDSFNELFDTSEQRKQSYLEKLKKQKLQIDSFKSKASIDEDYLQLSIDLDDLQQQGINTDQPRVIEQFFPDASILGPERLVPYVSDHQNRVFIELDFAQEQNIENYYKQQLDNNQDKKEDIKQQTNQYLERSSLGEDFTSDSIQTNTQSSITPDNTAQDIAELHPTSARERVESKPIISNTTEELQLISLELFQQMTENELISLKQNIELLRLNLNQWLQYNKQISNAIRNNDNNYELLTHQLIDYFHNELDLFHKNDLNNSKFRSIFQHQLQHIDDLLDEKKNHLVLFKYVRHQILNIGSHVSNDLIEQFNKYKNNFNKIQNQEYFNTQPIWTTDLELTIRTLDMNLQFIEQILDGKKLAEIIPDRPSMVIKTSGQSMQPMQSEIYKDLTLLRDNLLAIETNMKNRQTTINEEIIPQDLLKVDLSGRLQLIKNEHIVQKTNKEKLQTIKLNIDKVAGIDSEKLEFIEKLEEIHRALNIESNEIQKNLSNITTARYYSNHLNFPFDVKLKYLPVDDSGNLMEQPLCLVDEQNMPISDKLNVLRLPIESDRFHISNDKYELTIVDKNEIQLCEPITFKQLTMESIEFEYIDNNRQVVQIIETSSRHPINRSLRLNIKAVAFDKLPTRQVLFVVDNNDQLVLSKPIQLLEHISSSLDISDCNLVTYLYDEKTDEISLIPSEQRQITMQQAEFIAKKFLTYIVDKEKTIVSEPIEISDTGIEIRHAIETKISNRLDLFERKRNELFNNLKASENKNELLTTISDEYEFMNAYVEDRFDKLNIDEKIIELIVPILDKEYDDISIDETDYKREQSNMDHLLQLMKTFLELDEKLLEYRQAPTIDSTEIQKLENDLIHEITKISIELNDPFIASQVENLEQNIQLLDELRPIILTGIKNRAKIIQENFESLLINIQNKSDKLKGLKQVRFEYTQFLNTRINEEIEREKNIQNLYDKIERMQYDLHQKMADSLETINIEDLHKEIGHTYNINQMAIPHYLKTKNEKLIYMFNFILRFLQNKLNAIEQYRKELFDELEQFQAKSSDKENFYSQQSIFIQNQLKINNHKKLSKFIKKFKVLLNKIETINVKDLQYDFLYSKFDRSYEILVNKYRINLPAKTNIRSIRDILTTNRKTLKKDLQEFDTTKNELLRKLNVLKTKEELKQRSRIKSISQESHLSSLNAYIQQSNIEPLNIHHEFYAMKIQQISNDLDSMLDIKTYHHLRIYQQFLDQQKIDNERKLKYIEDEIAIARQYSLFDSLAREQMDDLVRQQNKHTQNDESIVKLQQILNEVVNHLQSKVILNPEQDENYDLIKQFKQRAIDTIIQSVQYERLIKQMPSNLLLLHGLHSDQEVLPSIIPCSTKLFKLETNASIEQEPQFERNHFQTDFIQQISSFDPIDSKIQILQTEINFLEKQYYESIVVGDFTRQLAVEQALAAKLQIMEPLQEKSTKNSRQQQIHRKIQDYVRKHIPEIQQEGAFVLSSKEEKHHDAHMQILPIAPPEAIIEERKKVSDHITIAPAVSKLLLQIDSKEQANLSLVTSNAKELYEQPQKQTSDLVDTQLPPKIPIPMKQAVTIEHDEEYNTVDAIHKIRIPSQSRFQSNSIENLNSSLYPINVDALPSPLLTVVGNVQKYSITEKKSKYRQTATSTQRSIAQSQRQYGEVYVRQRFVDMNSPTSKIDEQKKRADEKFREKVKPKTRLVTYEKTKQGNTVIHHRLDLSKRTFLVPQRTTYEENIEPIPPLIPVQRPTSTLKLQPKTSDINTISHFSQKSETKPSFYSTASLSPIQEEPEETESSKEILLHIMSKDLLVNKSSERLNFDNHEKIPSKLSDIVQPVEEITQVSPSSSPKDSEPTMNISEIKISTKSQQTKEQKIHRKKSSKRKHQPVVIKKIEDVEPEESLPTQVFDVELENQETEPVPPIVSEGKAIYHKVGGKLKKKKKKKKLKTSKQTNTKDNRITKKIEKLPEEESVILTPRKAIPFISATPNEQIDVEDYATIKSKRKRRKHSSKSPRKQSRSKSSKKSKPTSRRRRLKIDDKTESIPIDLKSVKNKDAIAMHLLNVKRFTVPPLSAINFDHTRHQYNNTNEKLHRTRLHSLKPMIKNFDFDNNHREHFHDIDAYDLDRELFDFNNDTKEIDQPAMFTEYIPEFFQKQAEEKHIRRTSLTAIRRDEDFSRRLAPRVPQLYNGWQPSDAICAHTDEFRPLNKYLMSDISYYFDDDFIDESGLFQKQSKLDEIESRVKQTTQRFRDDYIVKEFFNCWKDYTVEQARILELRRKRVTIDFREFWFQDALSDPFYSYFEQPLDCIKKQDNHHQMAYRLHKRLVRTGREQPKETMNGVDRSSFLPVLFNLPKNNLDRKVSLSRHRQLINYDDDKNYLVPLSNLITRHDDILPLIRERIQFINRSKAHINIHRDELAIKQILQNSSLLQQGTMKDLDTLITDYYASMVEQHDKQLLSKSFSSIVKLPVLKSSRQALTISH
ncbi:unnamed protein product [Rotaria magnacalcarata]|uniref:Uncharacterized protein n=1 Tax=Rotaria magnacalcarata TaxID=392030 RepID=A0A816CQN9_9BILA|nr:unnamed protein product [Rotaria magnacalcarata]